MSAVLSADRLSKRYGRTWALEDCSLEIPSGHVVGLVGPNGAGKSTLLNLAAGLLAPTRGSIAVLGATPASEVEMLSRIGFVAQETPLYPTLSVSDHLRLGAHLNPTWDDAMARDRIDRLGIEHSRPAGKLSGGQRAQLALTLAIAKRPKLLLLDEPVASLDPLARREFLQSLMEFVAEQDVTVVLSSHLVADLERVCDWLVILMAARVRLTGEVEHLLDAHHVLTGARRDARTLPSGVEIVSESHTERQSSLVVRTNQPILDPGWSVSSLGLEDLVLAYMKAPAAAPAFRALDGGEL